jgi:hypothetical protein
MNAWSERWLDTWALFSAVVACLAVTVLGLPSFLAASHNEGAWGTFTAVEREHRPCGRDGCDWSGIFFSDDGTVYNDEATYQKGIDHSGDQVRAQAVGDSGELYPEDDHTWLWLIAVDVPGVLYLLWWFKRRRWRGPRAEQLRAPR